MTDLETAYRDVADRVPLLGDADAALHAARRARRHRRTAYLAGTALVASAVLVAGQMTLDGRSSVPPANSRPITGERSAALARLREIVTPAYLNECETTRWQGCLTVSGTLDARFAHSVAEVVRPLRLAALPPGATCPTTEYTTVHNAGIGGRDLNAPGPVSLVVADTINHGSVNAEARAGGGWFTFKSSWFSAARYEGPVLIRSRRLDAPGRAAFGTDPAFTMLFSGGTSDSAVRPWPDALYVRHSGCYGFQVDGSTFSYELVLAVDVPSSMRFH
jgi:hypothetical protein